MKEKFNFQIQKKDICKQQLLSEILRGGKTLEKQFKILIIIPIYLFL